MSRFPKITETFILYEILALQHEGLEVAIFPLQRQAVRVMHPEAEALMAQVRFLPFISLSLIAVNLRCLLRQPLTYLRTWWEVLCGTWGSVNYFLGALVFFPKAVGIARQCEALGVTHLHAHFANHPALVAFIVYRLTGIDYSFTAHGSDIHKCQQMLAKKFSHSRFTVMISQYNKRFFDRHTGMDGGDKMPVIHCGIDSAIFHPVERPVIIGQPVQLLCVASFREVKGQRYLIAACERLMRRGIEFRLHLAGDGPQRGAIERQIRLGGLSRHIILHGALIRPKVIELLRHSDIFVLTSYHTPSGNREGIPVVIMEAMASGLPVVASDLSGIPELVADRQTGLLARPQDSKHIAAQLAQLINNAAMRRVMGQAGREKVQAEFELQHNVRQLIARFKRFG